MSEIICPVCNRPNPDDLQTCRFCGADLTPPPGVSDPAIRAGETPVPKKTSEFEKVKLPDKGPILAGQVPIPQDTGELEQALPSWLKSLREDKSSSEPELPADIFPAANAPVESDAAQPADTFGDSLDWLARFGHEDEEEEIPEWMAALRVPEEKPAPPADLPEAEPPTKEEETSLDWFTRIAPESKPADEEGLSAEEKALPAENLPDWLETLKAEEETPSAAGLEAPDWLTSLPESAEPAASSRAAFEPDWLKNLTEEPVAPQSEPPESPDWLKSPIEEPAAPQAAEAAIPALEETPDWLAALGAEAGAASAAAAETVFKDGALPEEPVPAEVPDWLKDFQLGGEPSFPEESERIEPAPLDAFSETTPHWLADIQKAAPIPSAVPPLVESSEGEPPPEAGQPKDTFSLETPDWLARLGAEPSVEPAAPTESVEPENLEMAELPSWVQAMKPVEAVVSDVKSAVAEEMGVSESSGPLAGLRGVLPGGAGVFPSRKPPAYSIKLQVTESQNRDANQLEQMIRNEGQPRGIKAAVIPSGVVWRWVISIILLLAIFLPLVSGTRFAPDLMLFPSEWERTHNLLDTLPANSSVLAVFDYDPALSGELQAAVAPVVDRILTRGAHLALISTSPTGPALAEQFLHSTQAAHLQAGVQYVNLGYLPGGPSGIYYFAGNLQEAIPQAVDGNDAWASPALQDVKQLSDFGLLLVITDNADTARSWVEQTQSAIGDTPVLMVVSAQAEPMVRPYFDSGQVDGMVTGLTGGKTYEQTYGTTGLARHYWDAFGTGTLAAVLLILVGGAGNALLAQRNRIKGGKA